MKRFHERLLGLVTAILLMLTCVAAAVPQISVRAASVDYPAELIRISTADNARNLNISGTADKSPLNTWTTNGEQNENWRFDYVGTDSRGTYFKIVDQGCGRLITPLGYAVTEGTEVVVFGSESAKEQHWYVIPVAQDKYGNDLHYKIVNYADPEMALTYDATTNRISLHKYTGAESQRWLLNAAGLQGFAGWCKDMSGDVKASVIGGLFGKVVEVSTFDELKAACTSTEPATIVITKNISGKTGSANYQISTGYDNGQRYYCQDNYIYLQPHKTIIGSYSANTLYNVYFRTYNENYGPAYDVIIRNIDCTHDTELNTDNIWEFAYGWNFWIDHCYFEGHDQIETSTLGSDDWDKFLNFKGTADYITISDCRFGHHEYGVLLGYPADDEATYKTYDGHPCVTLANNYYKDTVTRAPALCRYGYFHSLNNYVYNFNMGYTVHTACDIYAENCYYEKGGNVICDWNQITYAGVYAEDGSVFVNVSRTKQGEGTANNPSYSVASSFRPKNNYSYKALTAEEAKTYCTTYPGSQTSAAAMTYAAFAKTGVPSAGYVAAPDTEMQEAPIDPLTGTLIAELALKDKATYQSWSLLPSVKVGDKIYGDRDFTFTSLPPTLIGTELVQTACDAKNSSGELAVLTAAEDCTVYVGLDSRVEAVPSWMDKFTKMDMTAASSNDVTFVLYAIPVKAGQTLSLGSNEQSTYCINYTVLVQKARGYRCDLNCDSEFTIADIILLQKWLHAVPDTTLPYWQAGDLDADQVLDVFDLALLKRALLGEPASAVDVQPVTPAPVETKSAYEPDGFAFSGKVFLVGDSTVCEYDESTQQTLDRYGWGMKLAEQYNGVNVTDLALSGRSSRSFLTETAYQTLKSSLGTGDYLFIQFGHNDEKTDEAAYPGLGTYPGLDWSTLDQEGKDSQGRYSFEYLLTAYYINLAKGKGAVPVLVTPITRRGADGSPYYQAHTEYQKGMIGLGELYDVAVIDATSLTTALYESVGTDGTAAFHCWTDAANTTLDNTHLSSKGASTIAGIIAQQTKALGLTLGDYVK